MMHDARVKSRSTLPDEGVSLHQQCPAYGQLAASGD